MNVLNISHFNVWDLGYGKGRASTYLPLKGLVDKGHTVSWLTSAREQEIGDDARLAQDGIQVARFSVPLESWEQGILRTAVAKLHAWAFLALGFAAGCRLAGGMQPDLICAHNLISAFPAFLLSRVLRVPYVVKTYGFFVELFPQPLYWGKVAFKLPASLFMLVNDGTGGDTIARSLGVPDYKIAFLVNGIDKDLPSKADPSLRLSIAPHGEPTVLCAYRLVPSKQVDLLIRAIPRVVVQNPEVRFVIVGDGSERPALVRLSHELGVSQFVSFVGAIPHHVIPSYLCASDLFVSLNVGSSIANPVLEAMCCGKAVIALNTGSTSDLIKHLDNGFLLEPGEIDRLPEVILTLLNDRELRQSLGRRAREYMLDNWPTWEERVAQEVQLLEDIVKRHRRAATRT